MSTIFIQYLVCHNDFAPEEVNNTNDLISISLPRCLVLDLGMGPLKFDMHVYTHRDS